MEFNQEEVLYYTGRYAGRFKSLDSNKPINLFSKYINPFPFHLQKAQYTDLNTVLQNRVRKGGLYLTTGLKMNVSYERTVLTIELIMSVL